MRNAELMSSGKFSILVEKQKEKLRHSCIVLNETELNDIKIASSHAYFFLKRQPNEKSPVFPSLLQVGNGDLCMSSNEFAKIFQQRVALVFEKNITATDVRKLITTKMRNQPAHIQSAVALAEDHSIQVAHSYYNIEPPHEAVEKARKAMQEVAAQGI